MLCELRYLPVEYVLYFFLIKIYFREIFKLCFFYLNVAEPVFDEIS